MRCLVVGGTGFLGGAITDALAAGGHDVTVLSRGATVRGLPEGARALRADRHAGLGGLAGEGAFDWVFDTCAFALDAVTGLLDALAPSPARYVLISSLSAYGAFDRPGLDEDAPARDASADDLAVAQNLAPGARVSAMAYGASYGPLKRACERAAADRLGDRATALRVGLLIGAGDYTDRLAWWVRRIDMGTGDRRRVPAPASPSRPVQVIDARDVADFALRCAAEALGGVWNVTGTLLPLGELLGAVIAATGSPAELVWVDEDALAAAGVAPWTDMPLMAPGAPAFRHFLEVDTARARAAGLRTRALQETLEPLVAWDRGRRDTALKGGPTRAQEAELLASS